MSIDHRILKGEETKLRIINAAIEIVSKDGVGGLSAKKVSDIAGISKSNVFHHFGNIEGIMEAMLSGLVQGFSSNEYLRTTTLEAFFDGIGQMTFDLSEDEFSHYKVLFAFYGDVMFHDKFKERIRSIKVNFAKQLMDTVKNIEGVTMPKDLAEIIAIDIDGMGMHYLMDFDKDKYLRMWAIKSEMYINEIRKK